jgi:glycosyltransferase involved in cell wall biosynthesis
MTIGIVTISYNQGKYLSEAISSVRVSNGHVLEYVIVDPGSTDESREIIVNNRRNFSTVIYEPDEGPADGLNKGFAAIRQAEIFGYLNADDRFTAGALDFAIDYFEAHPDVDILLGSILILDAEGRVSPRGRRVDKLTPARYAEGLSYAWQQATFFRRSAYERAGGFNPGNRISWDGELVIDMILAGARVGYTSRVLGEFRIYNTSITGSLKTKHLAAFVRQHELVKKKIWAAGYPKLPRIVSKGLQLFYKLSPIRHGQNLAIGLTARFNRRTV